MPLRFDPHFAVSLRSASHGPPPYAPPTANRDEPSDGIISVTTPDSAPPLVPLQSEHERLLQHRPAVTTLNHPLARRHGPTAARARAAPYHPPVPRRASRDIPTTRAPAGPRPRQVAWCGGRAVHLAPSPTAEITAVAPWADRERGGLAARAGAAGATPCRWGLDGPPAAVRTLISLGKVANGGPGVRHKCRADDETCPSTDAPYQALC